MAVVKPNYQDPPVFAAMSEPDRTDDFVGRSDSLGTGVLSGMAVTQGTGTDYHVTVASGTCAVAGTVYTYAGGTLTPTTAGAGDRRDVVIYRVGTGVTILTGTVPTGLTGAWTTGSAALPPIKPTINESTDVVLAELYIAYNTTAIVTATNIVDKRNVIGADVLGGVLQPTANTESVVRASTLNELQPPTSALSMNGQQVKNGAVGSAVTDFSTLSNKLTDFTGTLSAPVTGYPGATATQFATMAQLGAWAPDSNSWVFVTGTQFTISSSTNYTTTYVAGTKVKWSESGTVKYGVVGSSAFASSVTTVNLIPTTDFVMTANPDTSSAYRSNGNPPDCPGHFTWVPRKSIASCTTTVGGTSVTVASGGFPNVSVGQLVSGSTIPTTGVPTVAAISGNTLTLSSGTGVTAGTATLLFGVTGVSALGAALYPFWGVDGSMLTCGYISYSNDTQNGAVYGLSPPVLPPTGTFSSAGIVVTDAGTSKVAVMLANAGAPLTIAGVTLSGSGPLGFAWSISFPIR